MPDTWLALYAKNGSLENLEPYLKKWNETEDLNNRALEFGRAMPTLRVVAHPVFALESDPDGWRGWVVAGQRVFAEYNKFLAAWLLHWGSGAPKATPQPVIRTAAPAIGDDVWPRRL